MRNDDAHIKSVSAKTTHAPAAAESPIHSFTCSERFTAHPEVTPKRV
jgi:hypothetical protein